MQPKNSVKYGPLRCVSHCPTLACQHQSVVPSPPLGICYNVLDYSPALLQHTSKFAPATQCPPPGFTVLAPRPSTPHIQSESQSMDPKPPPPRHYPSHCPITELQKSGHTPPPPPTLQYASQCPITPLQKHIVGANLCPPAPSPSSPYSVSGNNRFCGL